MLIITEWFFISVLIISTSSPNLRQGCIPLPPKSQTIDLCRFVYFDELQMQGALHIQNYEISRPPYVFEHGFNGSYFSKSKMLISIVYHISCLHFLPIVLNLPNAKCDPY